MKRDQDLTGINTPEDLKNGFRIGANSSIYAVAPSGSGKTRFILDLIKNRKRVFDQTINHCLYSYKTYSDQFSELENMPDLHLTFREDIFDLDFLKSYRRSIGEQPFFLVCDDLMYSWKGKENESFLLECLNVHGKKLNFTLLITGQELFPKVNFAKVLRQNIEYLVIFRSKNILADLARYSHTIFPNKSISRQFINLFNDRVMSRSYHYMMLSFSKREEGFLRIYENVLKSETNEICVTLLR